MKYTHKTMLFFSAIVLLFSCSKKSIFDDIEPNIKLTSIYSLTELPSSLGEKINIYKEKPLIIEHLNASSIFKYKASNYSDTSDDTTYNIVVTKTDGNESSIYTITGDKTTGTGSLNIDNNGTITNYTNISIIEEQVYN